MLNEQFQVTLQYCLFTLQHKETIDYSKEQQCTIKVITTELGR